MTEKLAEGWGWPSDAAMSKAHWFVNSRALCDRWAYFGQLVTGEGRQFRRCVVCEKRLDKRRAEAAKGKGA